MAGVNLRNFPDDLHLQVRKFQIELEEKGKKIKLEDLYAQIVEEGLKVMKTKNPSN